jgi:hypothetical protein
MMLGTVLVQPTTHLGPGVPVPSYRVPLAPELTIPYPFVRRSTAPALLHYAVAAYSTRTSVT